MYKPLPSYIQLKKSKIDGYGLFAKKHIDKNTNLGLSHVSIKEPTNMWIRTPLGGFINHSKKPNCEIFTDSENKNLFFIYAIKDIKKETELTIKYKTYNPEKE